jgi:hypothetical protein
VAVEKLDLSKLIEKTLRQEALQTTFLIFLDIFYPLNCRCFERNGVFQQPRLITPVVCAVAVFESATIPILIR